MLLTRHQTSRGPRWAADNHLLAELFDLRMLLAMRREDIRPFVEHTLTSEVAADPLLASIEMTQEVWGVGFPDQLAASQRPALFFKSIGWRAVGHTQPIRVRADSARSVPGPALTLVVNQHQEIIGYTLGNDITARSLVDENPLYLSPAKIFDGSCALGPGLQLIDSPAILHDLSITLEIMRASRSIYHGETRTSQITQRYADLIVFLFRELNFPHGAFLMLGIGLVLPADFTLASGDVVKIASSALMLENTVQ